MHYPIKKIFKKLNMLLKMYWLLNVSFTITLNPSTYIWFLLLLFMKLVNIGTIFNKKMRFI